MDKQQIFEILKGNIMEVLDDVKDEDIKLEGRLIDLGANSIDRVEIVTMTTEELNIKIEAGELSKINNIEGLVNKFYEKVV